MKILLIKRGAMGDILMSTPLIRQLKKSIPNLQLDFLTSVDCVGIIRNNPYLDNIMALDGKVFSTGQIFTLIKYVWQFRGKYDYVFVLDKHYYFSFIGRIISKNTVGFWRDKLSLPFLKYKVRYNDINRYQGLYYLDLLKASRLVDVNYDDCLLDFTVSDNDRLYIDNITQEFSLSKNNFVIVINSGGNQSFESGGIRMIPLDKMNLMLQELQHTQKVVLLGSNADKINYNNSLKHLSDCTNIINLAGQLTLEQSAALMFLAKNVFTTDCGAMHIAISQKLFTSLVCFFGPTCPNHILPPGNNINYLWEDMDIFDSDYQLYGKKPRKKAFFNKLDIVKFLKEYC